MSAAPLISTHPCRTSCTAKPLTMLCLPSTSCGFVVVGARKRSNGFSVTRCLVEDSLVLPGSSDVGVSEGGDDRFMPLSRRPRFSLTVEVFEKKPLWKRIFFASKKVQSIILLNVLTVIYASDIPALKEVEAVVEPAFFTMVRFVIAAIPFLPFVFKAQRDPQTRAAGIELGFWASCGCLCQALGLLTSDAGRASFISAFTVIVVPLIEGLFGATVPSITWVGALSSLLGVALLECGGSPPSVGDILNFLSAVFFGIHILRTEHFSRVSDKDKVLGVLGYEMCIMAFTSIIWFLLKDVCAEIHHLSFRSFTWSILWDWMGPFPWIPALYTGLFSTTMCLWVEMNAMNNVSATETAIIYGLEPLWGAAFAWFLLDERWEGTEWVGAALILFGSLIVQLLSPTAEKNEDEDNDCNVLTAEKHNGLSFSTVKVSSEKKLSDLLRKLERL